MQINPNSVRKLETFHDFGRNNLVSTTKLFADLSQVKAIEASREETK